MRRRLAITGCLLILFSACAKEERGQLAKRVGETPEAAATSAPPQTAVTAAPVQAGKSPAATRPGQTAAPVKTASATGAPVKSAAPGAVNRPRSGAYVFSLQGKRPPSGQQDYPPDSKLNVDVQSAGDEYTVTASNPADGTSTTTRTRWEPGRVLLLSLSITTPFGPLQCTYNPPLEIAHIPMKAETFPEQRSSGENCSVDSLKIKVAAQEEVEAAGRKWKTWRIENETQFRFGATQGTTVGIDWFSPDLGAEVKAERTQSGSFQSRTTTVLLSYPS